MNMTIYSVWGIWTFGAFIAWKLLGTLILLLSAGQLFWQFWRWIDDAEKREEVNENKDDCIDQEGRRRILYGNLFNIWPLNVEKDETAAWWGIVIIVSGIIAGVAIAIWPIVVAAAAIYGLGQAARSFRRLHKTIAKMMESLKKKADKGHNHKGKYQEVD